MTFPENGLFAIISDEDPYPRIGAENPDAATRSVITGAGDHIWTLTGEDREYRVSLVDLNTNQQWHSQNVDDQVVVGLDPKQIWSVHQHGEFTYTIQAVGNQREAWTLNSVGPHSPVTLRPLADPPSHDQLWRIIDVRQIPAPIPADVYE